MHDRLGDVRDVAKWPRSIRQAVDGIATVFAFAMQLALERRRNLGGDAALLAVIAAKDKEIRDLRIETELQRGRLKAMPAKNRPHFKPQDRLTILRMIWSGFWTLKDASTRLVLSRSTLRRWLRIYHGQDDSAKVGLFFGKSPWNKLADAVHDLIRDCRLEFPEPEIGVRTLVAQIVRAGVAVSRSTARRVLKTPPKDKTVGGVTAKREPDEAPTTPGHHILKPTSINRTWHTDLTTFRVFWMKIHVLAILDGFSRKLLALKVSLNTPTTADVLAAFKSAVAEFGVPRFVISDHGPQFREQFAEGLREMSRTLRAPKNIDHVQSKVKNPRFNGKCERVLKTLKLWQRVTLFFAALFDIERKVELFRGWYNTARVHQGLGGRIPDEVWNGTPRREATRYLATDKMQPAFHVTRTHHGDDPHLPIFKIRLAQFVKRTA